MRVRIIQQVENYVDVPDSLTTEQEVIDYMEKNDCWPDMSCGENLPASVPSLAPKMQIGSIYPTGTMMFLEYVGIAENDSFHYELLLDGGKSFPIIESKYTGKKFCLPWGDIINIAKKSGIDEED